MRQVITIPLKLSHKPMEKLRHKVFKCLNIKRISTRQFYFKVHTLWLHSLVYLPEHETLNWTLKVHAPFGV